MLIKKIIQTSLNCENDRISNNYHLIEYPEQLCHQMLKRSIWMTKKSGASCDIHRITWYFFLYSLAADACANNIWWATKYGSVEEFPLVLEQWKEGEHLWGGRNPASYPPIANTFPSFTVVQCLTLSPNSLKHTSAYDVKSFLQASIYNMKMLIT